MGRLGGSGPRWRRDAFTGNLGFAVGGPDPGLPVHLWLRGRMYSGVVGTSISSTPGCLGSNPLTISVTWNKLLNISVPQFSSL